MSEAERVSVAGMKVARVLYDFVVHEVIPVTGIEAAAFWQGLDGIIQKFAPHNHALLQRRDELQAKIDAQLDFEGDDVEEKETKR